MPLHFPEDNFLMLPSSWVLLVNIKSGYQFSFARCRTVREPPRHHTSGYFRASDFAKLVNYELIGLGQILPPKV